MEQYDFVKEELKSLIRTIKRQDYKSGKYLEDHLVFDTSLGGYIYTGNAEFFKEIYKRVVIRENHIKRF